MATRLFFGGGLFLAVVMGASLVGCAVDTETGSEDVDTMEDALGVPRGSCTLRVRAPDKTFTYVGASHKRTEIIRSEGYFGCSQGGEYNLKTCIQRQDADGWSTVHCHTDAGLINGSFGWNGPTQIDCPTATHTYRTRVTVQALDRRKTIHRTSDAVTLTGCRNQ